MSKKEQDPIPLRWSMTHVPWHLVCLDEVRLKPARWRKEQAVQVMDEARTGESEVLVS